MKRTYRKACGRTLNACVLFFGLVLTYLVIPEVANGIQPDTCGAFRTQTQGGWGSKANGNNPGTYRDAYFDEAFPDGLVLGCPGTGKTLTLTTSAEIEDFLPSGGQPKVLSNSEINPGKHYKNVLAGQLTALALTLAFDGNQDQFAEESTLFNFQTITQGMFEGYSVEEVFKIGNEILGGCRDDFEADQVNEILSQINESYVDGSRANNIISCTLQFGGVIGDRVWYDSNGDGFMQTNEYGLPGIEVMLALPGHDNLCGSADDEAFSTTTTNDDGRYRFDSIPLGDYAVWVNDGSVLPDTFITTFNNPHIVHLNSNDTVLNADFGYSTQGIVDLNLTQNFTVLANQYTPITYTYEVRNMGALPLDTIWLEDPLHSPVYVSGDENQNGKLDVGEVWIYQVTRTWTWGVGDRLALVSAEVHATDSYGHYSLDSDQVTTRFLRANMEIICPVESASPGDTITLTLVTRLINSQFIPSGHFAQLSAVALNVNTVPGQDWISGGPISSFWKDPSGDTDCNIPDAVIPALDANDHSDIDNGFGDADWIHEVKCVVPEYGNDTLQIIAKDRGMMRYYDGSSWANCGMVYGQDTLVLTISNPYQMVTTDLEGSKINGPRPKAGHCASKEQGIKIYPNPTAEKIYLSITSEFEDATISIFRGDGRFVSAVNCRSDCHMISLENEPSGIYILRVAAKNQAASYQIVKR